MSASQQPASLRTPAEFAVKTITTHLIATVNYAYLCKLQRRPTLHFHDAARILLFLFLPTILVVEALIDICRTLAQFVHNVGDDEDAHVRFYLSAALGMRSSQTKSDDSGKTSNEPVPLLDLGNKDCERTAVALGWGWAGKFLVLLFTLAQGIGTVVIWIRRANAPAAECFTFDHRNGAMGFASSLASLYGMLIMFTRSEWTLNQPLAPGRLKTRHRRNVELTIHVWVAILFHRVIYLSSEYQWFDHGYSSSVALFILVAVFLPRNWMRSASTLWPVAMLVIFAFIFRREIDAKFAIMTRLRALRSYLPFSIRPGMRSRMKLLAYGILIAWMFVDIALRLAIDISMPIIESYSTDKESTSHAYWVQDPLSEKLFVL